MLMNTTLRHSAIRPVIGLLAAFVLASSAAVAVTAETYAAKALPTMQYEDGSVACDSGGVTSASFTTEGGKGKWIHVTTTIKVNGGDPADPAGFDATRVERGTVFGPNVNYGTQFAGQTVQWTATLVNRKDIPLGPSATSDEVVCP
jgi:hypothetical protein